MRDLSTWRSVRVWERDVERELRQRHSLRLHGAVIGTLVVGCMWIAALLQAQLMAGQPLALRYAVTLGVGYAVYLLVLRLWVAALLRRESGWTGDVPLPDGSHGCVSGGDSPAAHAPSMATGGGGDFGGAGASGDFDVPQGAGELAGGALETAASADEGAIVVVPLVAIFLVASAALFGAGSLLLMFFGSEVLLAVALELAFGYATATAAYHMGREGWLSAALRLTWKPLLGALACGVLVGAAIEFFLPAANSLPDAIRILLAAGQV